MKPITINTINLSMSKEYNFLPGIYKPFIREYMEWNFALKDLLIDEEYEEAAQIRDQLTYIKESFQGDLKANNYTQEEAAEVCTMISQTLDKEILNRIF